MIILYIIIAYNPLLCLASQKMGHLFDCRYKK